MSTPRIELNWTRLLGFSQVTPGTGTLAHSPKIGPKEARGFDNLSAAAQPAEPGHEPRTVGAALHEKIGLKPKG